MQLRPCFLALLLGTLGTLTPAQPASAQVFQEPPSNGPAGEVLVDAFQFLNRGYNSPESQIILKLVEQNIASFPTAPSSGGFSYSFDSVLGIQVRNSRSFGPLFVERPLTSGKGQWSVSFNYQATRWNSLDGLSLSNGDLRVSSVYAQGLCCTQSSALSVNVRSSAAVFGFMRGVTDSLDLGVSVPISTLTVNGNGTGSSSCPSLRLCGPVGLSLWARSFDGHSTGLGDILAQAKVNLHRTATAQFGLLGTVRIPTGNRANGLGTGRLEPSLSMLAAAGSTRVAAHSRIGFTYAGRGFEVSGLGSNAFSETANLSSEFGYAGGIDVAAHSRVTISGDIIGRALLHAARIQLNSFTQSDGSTFVRLGTSATAFDATGSPASSTPTIHMLQGVGSVKVHLGKQYLALVNVLFPLNSAGLKPGITPVFGIERAF